MDAMIVLLSILDLYFEVEGASAVTAFKALKIFRIFRVLRLAKLIRSFVILNIFII